MGWPSLLWIQRKKSCVVVETQKEGLHLVEGINCYPSLVLKEELGRLIYLSIDSNELIMLLYLHNYRSLIRFHIPVHSFLSNLSINTFALACGFSIPAPEDASKLWLMKRSSPTKGTNINMYAKHLLFLILYFFGSKVESSLTISFQRILGMG